MPFKVCKVAGVSQMDSLPVALIADYPLEERDYKPYAQCNLCLDGEGLLLRMWAFEVSPPGGSELRAVLYLFPSRPEVALHVVMRPEEDCLFFLGEGDALTPVEAPAGFRLHPHSGEDLQGIYWGGMAHLPFAWLEELGGVDLATGRSFAGNFFKLCPGPEFRHMGSCFPADFARDPYAKGSMGEFLVVSY